MAKPEFKYVDEYSNGVPENSEDLLDEIQSLCNRVYNSLPAIARGASLDNTVQVDYRKRGIGASRQIVAGVREGDGEEVEVPVADLTEYLNQIVEGKEVVWVQRPLFFLVKEVIGFRDEVDLWNNYGIEAFYRAAEILDEWTSIGVAQRWN